MARAHQQTLVAGYECVGFGDKSGGQNRVIVGVATHRSGQRLCFHNLGIRFNRSDNFLGFLMAESGFDEHLLAQFFQDES